MKLHELVNKPPPPELPQLGSSDYSLLWHCGFWDGPISGLLAFAGNEYWFEMIQENADDNALDKWYRRFAIVKLNVEQLAVEHQVHDDFQQYVGTHTNYEANRRGQGVVHPVEQHHHFYDKHLEYCRSPRFHNCEVIAWFER